MADEPINWRGRPILDKAHAEELEHESGLAEFRDRHEQNQAEDHAYDAYKKKHHTLAAATHYAGMKAAQGSGDMEAAKKHGLMYAMHMRAIGSDPYGPVPDAVRGAMESPDHKSPYKFKAHKADSFLMGKSEAPLEKMGQVIPFPKPAAPAQPVEQGAPAPVVRVNAAHGKVVEDVSHLLPEGARAAGYAMRLERGPTILHHDGFATAHLTHNGQPVASQWHYPHGNPSTPIIHEGYNNTHRRAVQFLEGALAQHSAQYKGARDAQFAPILAQAKENAIANGHEAFEERMDANPGRSVKQVFRARNQPMPTEKSEHMEFKDLPVEVQLELLAKAAKNVLAKSEKPAAKTFADLSPEEQLRVLYTAAKNVLAKHEE